jgi:hypothetical protein
MSKRRLADFVLDAASTLGGAKSGAGGAARPLSVATDDQRSPGAGVGALPSREVLRHMGLTDSIDALTHNLQAWSLDGRSIRHHFGFGGADHTYVRQVQQKLLRQMGRLGPRVDDAHAAPGSGGSSSADVVAAASALSPAALTARAASRAAAAAASAGAPVAASPGASLMSVDSAGGTAAPVPSPSSSPRSVGSYVPSPLGAGAAPALLTIPPSGHHHHHHHHYQPHGAFGLPDFSVPYRARSSLVPHHAVAGGAASPAGVVPLGAPPGAGPTLLPAGVLAAGGVGSPPRPRRPLIDFSPVYATGAPGAGASSAAAAAITNCLPAGDVHMGGSAAAAAECVPRLPCAAVAATHGVPSTSTLMAMAVEAPCVPSASSRSPQRLRVE